MDYIVKVGNRKGQCSITIPVKAAIESGLNESSHAIIKVLPGNKLEVEKVGFTKNKKGTISRDKS